MLRKRSLHLRYRYIGIGLFIILMLGQMIPVVSSSERIILRLHGSNTIGSKLAVTLAKEYLKLLGAAEGTLSVTEAEEGLEKSITGMINGEEQSIEIHTYGSGTAFTGLLNRKCDIGMTSRPIKDDEAVLLKTLGNMTSYQCEHVIGLSGIAVIVNPENPLARISIQDLAKVFSSEITDWSGITNEYEGEIYVYSRDENSGTMDLLKSLVMGKKEIKSKETFTDSNELSRIVAGNPLAIGFIDLSYIGDAKALAIHRNNSRPLYPSVFSTATEDYLLSRRLFLYTPSSPIPHAKKFIEYVQSQAGQQIVEENGFVSLLAKTESYRIPEDSPAEYLKLTQNAQRVNFNCRFTVNSALLDNKAIVNIQFLIKLLSTPQYKNLQVILFGFTDSDGSEESNRILGKKRANAVAEKLREYGISSITLGIGEDLPVDTNDSDEGKAKNRRVEVWLR